MAHLQGSFARHVDDHQNLVFELLKAQFLAILDRGQLINGPRVCLCACSARLSVTKSHCGRDFGFLAELHQVPFFRDACQQLVARKASRHFDGGKRLES